MVRVRSESAAEEILAYQFDNRRSWQVNLIDPKKHQLSTDFVENQGAKDKKSLEENGYSLVESYSAGFRF